MRWAFLTLAGSLLLGGCHRLLPFGLAAADSASSRDHDLGPRLEQGGGPAEKGISGDSAADRGSITEAGPSNCAGKWCIYYLSGGEELTGVWGASDKDVWVVGKGGAIYHFNGKSWSRALAVTNQDLHAIHGHGNAVLAVGAGATVLRHSGAWALDSVPLGFGDRVLRGVAVISGRAYAVGTGGLILECVGTTWSALGSQTSQDLLAVATDGKTVIAVGRGSVVLSAAIPAGTGSTSFGPWSACNLDTEPADLSAVAFLSTFESASGLIGGSRTGPDYSGLLAGFGGLCTSLKLSIPVTGLATSGTAAHVSAEKGTVFLVPLSTFTVNEESVPGAGGVNFNAVWTSDSAAVATQSAVYFVGSKGTVAVLKP